MSSSHSGSAINDSSYVHAHRGSVEPHAPVSPPLILTTTFRRSEDQLPGPHFYSRVSNPNRDAFEEAMCILEHGTAACAFASSLAASMAIFLCLPPGSHIILPDDVYYGVHAQVLELLHAFDFSFTRVDMCNPEMVRSALRSNTTLIWLETPSNPLLKITDIRSIVEVVADLDIRVVCDNTWATPVLQNPLDLGCHAVVHSATKFIGGHSDVMLGCVVLRDNDDFAASIRRMQIVGGAVPSAAACWSATRGLQTLPVRIRAACASAQRIADFCSVHRGVQRVLYPGLTLHPQHECAMQQMSLPGSMLSICINGNATDALAVAGRLRLFAHATSLGGVESLIEHRASVEPDDSVTPENLLRLSVGLEDCDDLIADLDSALNALPN